MEDRLQLCTVKIHFSVSLTL